MIRGSASFWLPHYNSIMHHDKVYTNQIETASVWKQFDVCSSAINAILEIHLISKKTKLINKDPGSFLMLLHVCKTSHFMYLIYQYSLVEKAPVARIKTTEWVSAWTHCRTRGSSWNTKGLSSIAAMAWCLARDLSTRPWSPGTLLSFSCSTAHFPTAREGTDKHLSHKTVQKTCALERKKQTTWDIFVVLAPIPVKMQKLFLPA